MDEIKQLKEKQINDYISNTLLNEDSINIETMKSDLTFIIGEKPGIELEYKSEQLIVEDGKPPIRKEKLESIHIYYTYETQNTNGETEYRFGNLAYLTD